VLIETDALNNLRRASVALVFQLTAVDRRFIVQQLGEVAQATLQQIWIAFDELTDRI
jgi:mRNA-degrading endonuclease toxin of MazEF toxin-antitoxin module